MIIQFISKFICFPAVTSENKMRITSRYKRFLIKSGDHFDESNYLQLQDDLESIKASVSHLPADFRSDMIVSFVKNQFMKEEWKETNPSLAEKINSRTLAMECMEELFDSCSDNDLFREELEIYIRKMLQ